MANLGPEPGLYTYIYINKETDRCINRRESERPREQEREKKKRTMFHPPARVNPHDKWASHPAASCQRRLVSGQFLAYWLPLHYLELWRKRKMNISGGGSGDIFGWNSSKCVRTSKTPQNQRRSRHDKSNQTCVLNWLGELERGDNVQRFMRKYHIIVAKKAAQRQPPWELPMNTPLKTAIGMSHWCT